MPRTLRALLVLVVVLLTWSVCHAAVNYRLTAALEAQRDFGPLEQVLVSTDMFIVRWIHWGLLPIFLAPEAAIVAWVVQVKRGRLAPSEGAIARAQLKVWAMVLAAAVALGIITLSWSVWFPMAHIVPLGVTALVGFAWSYAGALWAALCLQNARYVAGRSRLRASHMALGALLVAGCAPLHILGAAIPVWLLWASRQEATT